MVCKIYNLEDELQNKKEICKKARIKVIYLEKFFAKKITDEELMRKIKMKLNEITNLLAGEAKINDSR